MSIYYSFYKYPSKYGTQAVGVGGSEGRIDPITGKTAKELNSDIVGFGNHAISKYLTIDEVLSE